MSEQLSDIEIINKVLGGDTSSYSLLVQRYQRYIFSLSLRFTKNREDAEEVAQDCFVKAYRSLGTFQQSAKFSTWLYSIVYHTSMSFLRKKKVQIISVDDEQHEHILEDYPSYLKANEIEYKSRTEHVNKAIQMLLPDDALIITLFYQGEQSLDEISKISGYETNTVKVKLHRARQRLRIKLEQLLQNEVKELL
ncbi:MAG: sigma-70 family RNA polymerase sigma factor [Chitinophagales bacterium]|nr:sigma-70 family RNA polymerase sigma factor [Chitinophagales bacterium]